MDQTPPRSRPKAVPSGRFTRAARLGGVGARVAGGMAMGGARELLQGRRPQLRDLAMTPGNVARFADELARMRGAAMKMGQLLSMDAGDILPPELAEILARLRADADHMPPRQLRDVLDAEWGKGWLRRFAKFDAHPIAAASIGQVHRARLPDGREVAIKVQYPGVRRSIDSDVTNVGALIRLSGLMPPGMDLAPFLDEARRQLHDEANYALEGQQLARFGALLEDAEDITLPMLIPELTTENVLVMTFVRGRPIEAMASADQPTRDRIIRILLDLLMREVFEFGLVQTDPNFANYRYDPDSGRVVLLDFGATREYAPERMAAYRAMVLAARDGSDDAIREAAIAVGFLSEQTAPHHVAALTAMIRLAGQPARSPGGHDFAADGLTDRLGEMGQALALDASFTDIPPMEVLYLQRKVAGLYLLASRLRARVDVGAIVDHRLA